MALAVLAVLGTWFALWRRSAGGGPAASDQVAVPAARGARREVARSEPEAVRAPQPSEEERPERTEQAAPEPPSGSPRSPATSRVHLTLALVLPDRQPVEVEHARATFTASTGQVVAIEGSGGTLEVELPAVPQQLAVEAEGFQHFPETLDLSVVDREGPRSLDSLTLERCQQPVYLWPEDWLPVVIRTRDGRSFQALAEDLGLEPKRFFVGAFRMAAAFEPFPAEAPFPDDPGPVRFAPPPGYQNTAMGDGIAGSLLLSEPRPFWVGLWIHGVHQEDRYLRPEDTELAFEIDLATMDARFARVTARVLDRDTGAPALDAVGTLKADTSAHRRHDLQDVAPDEEGLMTFERVIPGQHELTITRGANLFQRRIGLAPREHLHVDVPMGSGTGVPLRVVDADGEPLVSWIEIAPYRAGAATDDLYHPNLHRRTDGEGHYALPAPDQLSIVRARPHLYGTSSIGTANVLIDPAALPAELVLTAHRPVEVRFEAALPWVPGHRLTVTDELGLVVATVERIDDQVELVPGRYEVRRWCGEERLGSVMAVVTDQALVLHVP